MEKQKKMETGLIVDMPKTNGFMMDVEQQEKYAAFNDTYTAQGARTRIR